MKNKAATKIQSINDFAETNPRKQRELEEQLKTSKLEDILSPIYFFQNVNATFIGW